jgi:DNA adenine methylase
MRTQPPHIEPFLKWPGGKRRLLGEIIPRVPKFEGRFIEPFLGAGAVFFAMNRETAKVGNDYNTGLIETYEVVRDDVEALIAELEKLQNNKEEFLRVRHLDRSPDFNSLTPVSRAARFIYLNKTCFNGLYRVNRSGYFNVPFGYYKKPDFVMRERLNAVSDFLNAMSAEGPLVELYSGDYQGVTSTASDRDFVYLDPPYDPVSATSAFVAYQRGGFGTPEQERLQAEVERLTLLGVPVIVSNSDTPFMRKLYGNGDLFRITPLKVNRSISANASSRNRADEILVTNDVAIDWGGGQ